MYTHKQDIKIIKFEYFSCNINWLYFFQGPGSCHGDSGGPLFVDGHGKSTKQHILLGLTSSGTSRIGHCGGIGNPTHYTRISKLLPWIKIYVKDAELC